MSKRKKWGGICKNKFPIPNRTIIFLGAIALYWVWLFYMTQPATDKNTYCCEEEIISVEVLAIDYRGTDKLVLHASDEFYLLDFPWRDHRKTQIYADNLLSTDEKVTISIWKHFPRYIFFVPRNSLFCVLQATEVRTSSDVLWAVDEHNEFQRTERIAGIIGGAIVTSLIGIFEYYTWIIDCFPQRKRKK